MFEYTYISFATKNTRYERFAENWCENMRVLGIKHDIEILPAIKRPPNVTDLYYKRYIGRKMRVQYILRKLEDHSSPIVFMDCDDRLTNKPELPSEVFDFGYIKNPTKAQRRLFMLAGFLVFQPTNNARHFLKVWDYLCQWDELEPMGGNHIRLIHTFNICNDVEVRKLKGFRAMNLTDKVLPYWRQDGNK